MRKFVVERETPSVGQRAFCNSAEVAHTSSAMLRQLGAGSGGNTVCVEGDETCCVYLVEDEEAARMHSEQKGFPANRVAESGRITDPTTATR